MDYKPLVYYIRGMHIHLPISHGFSCQAPSHPLGHPSETVGCWVHLVWREANDSTVVVNPNKCHGKTGKTLEKKCQNDDDDDDDEDEDEDEEEGGGWYQ